LIVGDSTACSLWTGLQAVGKAEGIPVGQGSVFGCGVASDQITTTRNEPVTPHSQRCHDMVEATIGPALARVRPTVVLWMSIWEKSDLVVDGRTVVAGTPAGDAEINKRMDEALARLTVGGARVVMVTEAAQAPNPARGTQGTDPRADDAGYARLNQLLERFARRHHDRVTVVDLASQLCPNGPPCPERARALGDIVARPDGRHFTPEASTRVARWVLEAIARGEQG
jgi:hypothetical protein